MSQDTNGMQDRNGLEDVNRMHDVNGPEDTNRLQNDGLADKGNGEKPSGNQQLRRGAEILSIIFHPLFIPLYGLLIIYSSQTLLSFIPSQVKRMVVILVTANNVLLPMALAAVLYTRGAISSFHARRTNERVLLLTFVLLMYSLTAFVLMRMQVPTLFKAYFISIAAVTLVTLIITAFFRISMHAVGLGGLLVLIAFMIILYNISMMWQIITVFLLGGALMSSRIYLKDHTLSEVWTGLVAGAAVMGLSLFFMLK